MDTIYNSFKQSCNIPFPLRSYLELHAMHICCDKYKWFISLNLLTSAFTSDFLPSTTELDGCELGADAVYSVSKA